MYRKWNSQVDTELFQQKCDFDSANVSSQSHNNWYKNYRLRCVSIYREMFLRFLVNHKKKLKMRLNESFFVFHSFIFLFAIVTSGVSLYHQIQIRNKPTCTENDVNGNGITNQSPTRQSNQTKEKSTFQQIFQCFDVTDNYNRLFQTSPSSGSFLSTIAGMRLILNSSNAFCFLFWCNTSFSEL